MSEKTTNGVGSFTRLLPILGSIGSALAAVVVGTIWVSAVSGNALSALNLAREVEARQNESSRQLSEARTKIVELQTKLTEVETQFCASDDVRNLMHSYDLRIESLLWQKNYPGTIFPTDNALYPKICNRGEQQEH